MLRSSMQAAVTMGQLQKKLDVIGHNMSNTDTPGYKSRQADFSSLLFQQMDNLDEVPPANRRTPNGIRIGSGAYLASTDLNMTTGSLKGTGRALDVAIRQDNHMFQIQTTQNGETQTMYTRDGAFSFSANNDGTVSLVTSNGNPVLGQNGPIRLNDNFDSFTIREDGTIMVERNGTNQQEAQLAMVEATRPRFLEAVGNNLLAIPDGAEVNAGGIIAEVAPGAVSVKQGSLETSNVDLSKEMTDMMTTQRAYQFNSQSISIGDQMLGLVNQLR